MAAPSPASDVGPNERAPWRSVAIPTEHGGWGLTLEPVVLGLVVAPSLAGAAIAVAAFAAFVVRTPLRVVLVDRHRHRRLPRTALAGRIAAVELALLALLGATALVLAGPGFLAPLAVAAPLVGVELWFDARSRSRRLVPELAGSVGIAAVAAAIVIAGGGSTVDAAGAWLVLAARSVASLPFVRIQLQRAKAQPFHLGHSDAAQAVAVVAVAVGAVAGAVPLVAVAAVALLAVVQVVLVRRPPPRAAIIGAQQMVFGLTVAVTTALGMLAP
jgi:hypothetical protein